MNRHKLDRLFELARKEPIPASPEDFAATVLRAIRGEPGTAAPEAASIFDRLNLLFPRIVLAAAVVIILCIALDFGMTAAGMPGVGEGMSRISAQWFLTPEEFQL